MSEPLNRIDLDLLAARGCTAPGCDHAHGGPAYLVGACHPDADVEVSYEAGTGVLLIACRRCHRPVARVAVAP